MQQTTFETSTRWFVLENHAIIAWVGRGLPTRAKIKNPLVYSFAKTAIVKDKVNRIFLAVCNRRERKNHGLFHKSTPFYLYAIIFWMANSAFFA